MTSKELDGLFSYSCKVFLARIFILIFLAVSVQVHQNNNIGLPFSYKTGKMAQMKNAELELLLRT